MPLSLSYFSEFWTALLEQLRTLLPAHGNLQEEINASLYYGPRFSLYIFGCQIRIPDAVISMWLTMALVTLLAVILSRNLKLLPGKKQTISEQLLLLIQNAAESSGLSKEQAKSVIPFVGTVGIFLTVSNLTSLIKIKPPAQNIAFPVALALVSIAYVIYKGICFVGLKGFWASLIQPAPALLPFKILDYLIKPVSLSFRLFGNIFGAFILMKFIEIVVPLLIPGLLGIWFDLADGLIQGVVFAYLTLTYIGEIVEGAHEAELAKQEKAKKKGRR